LIDPDHQHNYLTINRTIGGQNFVLMIQFLISHPGQLNALLTALICHLGLTQRKLFAQHLITINLIKLLPLNFLVSKFAIGIFSLSIISNTPRYYWSERLIMRIFSLEFKLYIYTHACVNPSLFVVLEVEVLKLCHVSFHVCYDCVQRQSFFFVWCV